MKKILKGIISIIIGSQFLAMTAYAKPDWPADTGILAEGGIVYDVDSGTMIFGQNSRRTYYPASITKLLTALVVLENSSLDEMVTFSDDAINNVEAGSGNSLSLAVGDQMTVEDCLYALLLKSSNQAANALAEHVGGSRDGFVEMMNTKIAELGCTSSRFKNPSGLNDEEQLVTPYDMALIAKAAFANEQLLAISSARSYTLPVTTNNPEGLTITMEHRILRADEGSQYYVEGAVAGKTGYTSSAGNTLVTYAERDGRRLISIVLKGTQPQYYLDSATLLEFGFDRFQNVDVAQQGLSYTTGDTPVTIGDKSYDPSELTYSTPSVITLPDEAGFADAEETLDTVLPEDHPEGAVALLRYTYNERNIGQVYLCLKNPPVEVLADIPASEGVTVPETTEVQPETTTEPIDTPKPEKTRNGGITKILAVIGIVVAAVLVTGGGYLLYQEKQEAKRREERRARRRQRLRESGDEAEFQRYMEERKRKK